MTAGPRASGRVALRRGLLIGAGVAAVAEIIAALVPWVVFQLPLDHVSIPGYAAPNSAGVATAGLGVFATFIAGARVATATATPPGWIARLSGAGLAVVGFAVVAIINATTNRIAADDPGLTRFALDNAGRLVDHNPGPGVAMALVAGVALAVIGCALLFADNPDRRGSDR